MSLGVASDLEMKHKDKQIGSPVCIHFIHTVQKTHINHDKVIQSAELSYEMQPTL